MFKAKYLPYSLKFIIPGGTSRGVLKTKETYFIVVYAEKGNKFGIGECALFKGLSFDDRPNYEEKLKEVVAKVNSGVPIIDLIKKYEKWPSIQFGLETAYLSIQSPNPFYLFKNGFSNKIAGIEINGLVWMGDWEFMYNQLKEKLELGFTCIKIKIGAIDFEKELDLLKKIREEFDSSQVEIRVDANGAFTPKNAYAKLNDLSKFSIHSIEQPIKQGQVSEMRKLCDKNIIPIALDEELIGVVKPSEKEALLKEIQPQYIILKPALVGGFNGTNEWVYLAEKLTIKWWVTSALESNIGLNAIAQYLGSKSNKMPQGLGTGQLFSNNITSPLHLRANELWYGEGNWNLSPLNI